MQPQPVYPKNNVEGAQGGEVERRRLGVGGTSRLDRQSERAGVMSDGTSGDGTSIDNEQWAWHIFPKSRDLLGLDEVRVDEAGRGS